MRANKQDVLSALADPPLRDWRLVDRMERLLKAPPFIVPTLDRSSRGVGVEYYVDKDWNPTPFRGDGPTPLTSEVHRRFSLLVSEFGKFLIAQSRACTRRSDTTWNYSQLDSPCNPNLTRVAETIAPQLGLQYIDAFALHNIDLEWEELPKHHEAEFVARLDYSEPNAFSLLFYEWD
jgi:hypothetical protein